MTHPNLDDGWQEYSFQKFTGDAALLRTLMPVFRVVFYAGAIAFLRSLTAQDADVWEARVAELQEELDRFLTSIEHGKTEIRL